MSTMSERVMLPHVRELASALSYRWPDTGAIGAYVRAIADLDPADVERACADLAKTETTWPRPVTLRQRIEALKRRRTLRTPGLMTVGETWCDPTTGEVVLLYRCRECEDTGWCPVTPDGVLLTWVDVRDGTARHAAVRKCTCGRLAQSKTERAQQEARES